KMNKETIIKLDEVVKFKREILNKIRIMKERKINNDTLFEIIDKECNSNHLELMKILKDLDITEEFTFTEDDIIDLITNSFDVSDFFTLGNLKEAMEDEKKNFTNTDGEIQSILDSLVEHDQIKSLANGVYITN